MLSALPGRWRWGRVVVRIVLGLMLVSGAVFALRQLGNDPSFAEIPADLRLWPLAVALAIRGACLATYPAAWLVLYRGVGGRISLADAYRVYLIANVGKYVPGKVALVAGRVAMLRERGEAPVTVVTSTVLEVLLGLLAAAIAALVCVPSILWEWGFTESRSLLPWMLVLGLPAGLIGLHPRVLGPVLAVVAGLLPRRAGPMHATVPAYRIVLLVMSADLLQGALSGLVLLVTTWSVYPLGLEWLPLTIGAWAISMLLAFAVPIAPAGLGVREGVVAVMLATAMPVPVAALVTVLSRLLSVGAELLAAGVAISARADPKR